MRSPTACARGSGARARSRASAAWSLRFSPTGEPVADADARSQEDRRRVDRARADDHLARVDFLTGREAHADGVPAVEHHAVHQASPRTDEVRAVARGFEVRVVRRHPLAVAQRQREAADAGRAGRVVVVGTSGSRATSSRRAARGRVAAASSSGVATRGSDRPCRADRRRRSRRRPRRAGRRRASPASPSPRTRTRRPAFVVVDGAAERTHRVDRRRSTGAAPAHVERRRVPVGAGRDESRPDTTGFDQGLEEVRRVQTAGASDGR